MDTRQRALTAGVTAMVLILVTQVQSAEILTGRRVASFNGDWKFAKGSQAGAEKPGFDDSAWQAVRLPHDWAIPAPSIRARTAMPANCPGGARAGTARSFTLDKAADGSRVYFDFDGVMAFPKVYVNGQLAGQWDYGYMSFRVDATPYVKFGERNVIAVYVDTRNHGTRWYPGAGIYRKVTMTICNPVHVAHWGTFVTTPKVDETSATVRVRSTIENHLDEQAQAVVEIGCLRPGRQARGHRPQSRLRSPSRPAARASSISRSRSEARSDGTSTARNCTPPR